MLAGAAGRPAESSGRVTERPGTPMEHPGTVTDDAGKASKRPGTTTEERERRQIGRESRRVANNPLKSVKKWVLPLRSHGRGQKETVFAARKHKTAKFPGL